MATAAQIADLRRMVNEPTDATYSDDTLADLIDAASNVDAAAADVWTEKAAALSGIVDVAEGSSRRSLGDLHKQALEMAKHFTATSVSPSGGRTPARTRAIERA